MGECMYLTTIEHEGHSWRVELKVTSGAETPGTLKFSFVRADTGGTPSYTWHVPTELADALHLEGRLSEEVLRRQLESALAEERAVDAMHTGRSGIGRRGYAG